LRWRNWSHPCLIDHERARRRLVSIEENLMGLGTILLIVLILMLIGAIPTWPHSRNWGYAPSGVLGLVVVVIIVLLLMGRL
jgi:Na+/melibiose symporter-like transporter